VLTAAAAGLLAGLSLIIAIGAQNAFVLRQGLARQHVGLVVAICAISDLVLICCGVAGLGLVLDRAPGVVDVVRWLGVAFLTGYGVLALRRAWQGSESLEAARAGAGSARAVAATALALTWLNPHVYLDTVLLLGSIASTHGDDRWWFALGASVGSLVWFTALGYGARLGHRLLATERAWRVLDALVGLTMLGIAVMLARHG
jgi:L-lysine exporter family protein LysE/ArgO